MITQQRRLNTLLLLRYFSVGVRVFKNINSILWFIHIGADMVENYLFVTAFSLHFSTLLWPLFYHTKCLDRLYDFLLTNKFCFRATAPQIWCRNISKEVKGLCSRVALLSCPTMNHPHVMFAFLTPTFTHTPLMKESAYNRFCAWMLVQVPPGKPWCSPSRSCGQLFCQQKELKCSRGPRRWKKYGLLYRPQAASCVTSTSYCRRWCVYSSPCCKYTVKGFPFSLY